MTIYWQRCDLCRRYVPVSDCGASRAEGARLRLCYACYRLLRLEALCAGAWREAREVPKTAAATEKTREEKFKEIEQIFEILE